MYYDKERTRPGREEKFAGVNFPSEPLRAGSDRIFTLFHSDGSNDEWGVKFTVEAPTKDVASLSEKTDVELLRRDWASSGWGKAEDDVLVSLLNMVAEKNRMEAIWTEAESK